MGCPELEDLEHHLAGDLDGEARESLSEHVATCPTCAQRVEEISENLQAIGSMREALRAVTPEPDPPAPERIGSFKIVEEIARGGMGVVYLAEQDRPRRQVALKVLRPGLTSPDTLRRFELEAEVLARLQHPGIATVYEAGVTSISTAAATDRVPYIAMEYVRGARLDRFVETHDLSIEQRLELVARIADAVHHAHVKGLVHRDLKPGNVLIETETAGPGRPKVLDFGVARVVDREGTLHTSTGQILGTVPYMSPEQLAGDPSAVDLRSDVYALGVIGFETLTGELPHDVKKKSIAEAARTIRDDEPRSPERLDPRLRGDVATILLRALEKDPARRYASAAELAADIRRFLRREPIQARPQSTGYQLRRFAQRNRGLAAALAGLALVLIGAAIVSGVLAVRAQERLEESRRQADKFAAVNRFVEEMLASASPEKNPGRRDVTVREALALGAQELDDGSLADQPAIELGVRATIGNTFRALGDFDAARGQLERAVRLGRTLFPGGHEDVADSLNKLGRVVVELGEYASAAALFRESLEMRERLSGGKTAEAAATLNNLGLALTEMGDNEAALEIHQRALELRREVFGDSHEDVASSLNNMAFAYYRLHDLPRAEALFRESFEMDLEIRGELHPNVAATMNNLALVVREQGRSDEAEPLQRRALELEREIYGPEHPKLAVSLQNLALLLVANGELDEAGDLFAEALELERGARGPGHPGVANLLGNYARLYEKRGEFDRAEELHGEAMAIRREALGAEHVATLGSRFNLARVARARGDKERSAESFAVLAADARRILPDSSGALLTILTEYAMCLLDLGRRDDAEAILREAHTVGTNGGGTHPRFQEVVDTLAELEG